MIQVAMNGNHTILVSGSITYDHILDFPGKFQEHILPEHMHDLSVAFYVNHVSETYGGTGANIAYNLGLLGAEPILLAVAGGDFLPFKKWLERHHVNTQYVKIIERERTSLVYLMTDKINSQISAFYPGATSHYPKLPKLDAMHIDFAISSPAGTEDTWKMATFFKKAKIPFAFDPGQRITALSKKQIMKALAGARMLFANEYEHAVLKKTTGLSSKELLRFVDIVITTMGVKGSTIETKQQKIHVAASRPKKVVDPTGAGDAYRAGFLYGYLNGMDLRTCAEIGSIISTFAIERYGTQEHTFTKKHIASRLKKHYHKRIALP